MTASKSFFYSEISLSDSSQNQRGAGVIEVLLAMAIVALLAPFLYNQIAETSRDIRDITTAKKIVALRDPILNFVRLNQDKWPDYAQIKLDDTELAQISDVSHAGFIDKYLIQGAAVTDIYLAFSPNDSNLRTAKIASNIGTDAATVNPDGIAYGNFWAVAAPEFKPGDLIYRISYDFSNEDNSRYLHRASTGDDELNVMKRNLDMGKFDIYNIGTIAVDSGKIMDASTAFVEAKQTTANSTIFAGGATLDANSSHIGSMRVTGDIIGFRNIVANQLNDNKFSTDGRIIADRATVKNSVNVGHNMVLKSNSTRTISGFVGVMTHSVETPFLSADEIIFHENFGLTVSGELLMSTSSPLKIGNWTFPSTTPPKFSSFVLARAPIPTTPDTSEFDIIIKSGWQDAMPKQNTGPKK